jgi:serine/threonine protein kinase/Tfp pilus assembly protein PilF
MTLSAAASQPSAPSDAGFADLVEELTGRLHAGESVDLDAFLRDHPEHAERLARLLPALRLLADGSRSRPDGLAVESAQDGSDSLAGTLGDFRIVREVGRGGMGIVYQAEQISLGRRVALKVLPFAGALDPRHLQRFKNEAHAAAQLHHTNIVPVHFVGCERGVHFYAMQFIEGHSLADAIAQLRQKENDQRASRKAAKDAKEDLNATAPFAPSRLCVSPSDKPNAPTPPVAALSTIRSTKDAAYFRSIAELGIQAAEALDFAHEHGVLHRDVKPANLLVDADARLWITDFGLAQVQGDARMTMSGDLVGTLRYMSPEQALAKRVVVDHRTDIYSLGATLYELLTLEPAFTGTDRQELLRQIAFEEPRRPRRRNESIPAELETIVLKALEKNPADRYATAKELADDLRHFVKDEPIRARRPTLARRAIKWARRHRSAAIAGAVCLLVTLGVTLCSIGWVLGDRASRKRQAEAVVLEALETVKPGLEQGNPWDRALVSALRQAEAQLQFGLLSPVLERRVKQLQKDVKMLAELERISLEPARGVRGNRFYHALSPYEYMVAFKKYGIDVARLEQEEAVGLLQRSAIRHHLVAALYEWSIAVSQGRETHDQAEAGRIRALADILLHPWVKQLESAARSGDQHELERVLQSAPIAELGSAMTRFLSLLLGPSTPQSDDRASLRNVEFLRLVQARYPADFWINQRLGMALWWSKSPRPQEAVGFLRVSVALRPDSPCARLNLGEVLRLLGRLDEAIAATQKAIDLEPDWASAHNNLGVGLTERGMLDKAIAELNEAIRLNPRFFGSHCNLGDPLRAKGMLDEAITEYRKAIELNPDSVSAHFKLGVALRAKGMLDAAIAEFRKAIELRPDSAEAHRQLNKALLWVELEPGLPKIMKGEAQPADIAERLELARMCDESKGFYLAAFRFYSDAFAAQPQLADDLQHQHRFNAACAAALAGCGQGWRADQTEEKERVRLRRQGLDWLRADLAAYRQLLNKGPDKTRAVIVQRMRHWQEDTDFAGVRGADALAKLPESERAEWSKLWQEVATLGKQAEERKGAQQAPVTEPELVPPPKASDK